MTAVLTPHNPQHKPVTSPTTTTTPATTTTTACSSPQQSLPTTMQDASGNTAPPAQHSSSTASANPKAKHLAPIRTTSSPSPRGPNTQRSNKSRSRSRSTRRTSKLSTFSQARNSTRPASNVFPLFPSSLSYALVRDFAYPAFHPLHFGPQPYSAARSSTTSNATSPSFGAFGGDRRLSDPPPSWEGSRGMWSAGPWGGDGGALYGSSGGDQLPSTSFGYGYEDEDGDAAGRLAKNHRKSRSFAQGEDGRGRRRRSSKGRQEKKKKREADKGENKPRQASQAHLGTGLDSQGFFAPPPGAEDDEEDDDEDEDDDVSDLESEQDGPELPSSSYGHQWRYTTSPPLHDVSDPHNHHHHQFYQQNPHHQSYIDPSDPFSQQNNSVFQQHDHDESFAGPSLALYTFEPENANELALTEGQIIQVGYRHGQGWLVAMDLETGEQGLVPEEYVRLLRDIEGWGEEDEEEDETTGDVSTAAGVGEAESALSAGGAVGGGVGEAIPHRTK